MDETAPQPNPTPPVAEKRPAAQTLHGDTREDPYAWMKDDNWQAVMREPALLEPAVRAHLEAENAYVEAVMTSQKGLAEALFQEMKGRLKEDDSSVPSPDGPYRYYRRFAIGGQHPVFCREPRDGGDEQVLLDGDKEAEGESFFRVAACEHSPDHGRLAFAIDTNGSEIYRIGCRDLISGEDLADVIEGAHGNLEWAADSKTLFYTVLDDNHRPFAVRRHRLGDDAADDVTVYEEKDPGFFVGVSKTESGRFVVIDAHDHQTSEIHLIDAADPETPPRLIEARRKGVEYSASDRGGELLILTNDDGAEDFKIVTAPVGAPDRGNWREWVAHHPGRLILGLRLFKDFVARLERTDGLNRIVVSDFADGSEHEIAFEEEAYSLELWGGYEFETTTLRFAYSSMTTPERVYDYDMASRQRTLMKEQEVPSGHDPADYVTRRLMAPAADGEQVPVTVLHRADTPVDGSAPLLLYGYGAYGYAIPAAFGTARLSLVDRGFVYAIAHIRGGKDRGYRWYREGRLEKKTNTFTDFIAAAEALVAGRFTTKGRIAAHGGSAGGMVMGAVANLRPDLFGAIVAEVPFVDVLNTMCDAELPLTPPEWPEWGNPIDSAEAYGTIRAYSPYDNIDAKDYPPIFATAGLTDPRVTYWEPAKWVARLRELKTDANPVLFKTNMEAGHAGAAGRFDKLRETALAYAFVLKVLAKKS